MRKPGAKLPEVGSEVWSQCAAMMQDRQQQDLTGQTEAQLQQALVLEDVQKFALRELPYPNTRKPGSSDPGRCSRDLRHGSAYFPRAGKLLPGFARPSDPFVLKAAGAGSRVLRIGRGGGKLRRRCKAGDLVAVDQFLSCTSLNLRRPASTANQATPINASSDRNLASPACLEPSASSWRFPRQMFSFCHRSLMLPRGADRTAGLRDSCL